MGKSDKNDGVTDSVRDLRVRATYFAPSRIGQDPPYIGQKTQHIDRPVPIEKILYEGQTRRCWCR